MVIWGRKDTPFDMLLVFSLRPLMLGAKAGVQAHLDALNAALPLEGRVSVQDLIPDGRVLSHEEVETLVPEWNAQTGSKQARCHVPHHGLATVRNGGADWFASICFQCANVFIAGPSATEGHRIIRFEGCAFEARLNAFLGK